MTFKDRSVDTRENVASKLSSDLAREVTIPWLYVAASPWTRIGLADYAKKAFKVSFQNKSKPENDFNYIYI